MSSIAFCLQLDASEIGGSESEDFALVAKRPLSSLQDSGCQSQTAIKPHLDRGVHDGFNQPNLDLIPRTAISESTQNDDQVSTKPAAKAVAKPATKYQCPTWMKRPTFANA
jgi:hypothetical protein